MTKTPLCVNCGNILYVVNIRREAIGFICPQCDYHFVKDPSKDFEKLAKRISEKTKPQFKKTLVTICSVCRLSKYVKCQKNTKRIWRKEGFNVVGFGPTLYACWCENPSHKKYEKNTSWGQDHPKIRRVSY